MNKTYTIGRDPSCDIVIVDPTDVVSRVHASLKIKGNGKYFLIDQSRNGTYVNGIKMSSNEEIPVSRKDVISFAHVRDLNWDLIPKHKDFKKLGIILAVAFLAVGCLCYLLLRPKAEPVITLQEQQEVPFETSDVPSVKDTIVKDTIFVKPRPVRIQKPKKSKPEVENKEKPIKEEPEVVNPLL